MAGTAFGQSATPEEPFMKVCSGKVPPPCATPPAIIHESRPSYSKEAKKAKIAGTELLGLVVGKDGEPSNIRVIKSLGYGLDEKAIDAVKKWRFKPSTFNGEPVNVDIRIEIEFRLY